MAVERGDRVISGPVEFSFEDFAPEEPAEADAQAASAQAPDTTDLQGTPPAAPLSDIDRRPPAPPPESKSETKPEPPKVYETRWEERKSEDEADDEPRHPGGDLVIWHKGEGGVPEHVKERVREVHERLTLDPVASAEAGRLGEGAQADVATLVVAGIATEVVKHRKEEKKQRELEADEAKPLRERQLEQVKEDPASVREMIVAAGPRPGSKWAQLVEAPQKAAENIEKESEPEDFFEKLKLTGPEVYACVGFNQNAKQVDGKSRGPQSIEKYRKWEEEKLKKTKILYNMQMRMGQRKDAMNVVFGFVKQQNEEVIKAQGRWGETHDDSKVRAETLYGQLPPVDPEPQIRRLQEIVRVVYGNEVVRGNSEPADRFRLDITRDIARIKENYELRAAFNADPEAFIAGKRPELSPDAQEAWALVSALEVQAEIKYGDGDVGAAVAKQMNELTTQTKRQIGSQFYYEHPEIALQGKGPHMTAESLESAILNTGLLYHVMMREDPDIAEQFLAQTTNEITALVEGEKALALLETDPREFAKQASILPFGEEGNKMLTAPALEKMLEQWQERMLTEYGAKNAKPSTKAQATLWAINSRLAALTSGEADVHEHERAVANADLARAEEAEQFKGNRALLLSGPHEKADGPTGPLLAFMASSGAYDAIDVFGARAWGGEHLGGPLGTPINRLKTHIPGGRRYITILAEGRIPRGIHPDFFGRQLEDNGTVAIQVRTGINEGFATHLIRYYDPKGFADQFPDDLKKKEPLRSVYWPKGAAVRGGARFRWALAPSAVCRWAADEETGEINLTFGHVEHFDDRDEDRTLVLCRDKEDGTPSDTYTALLAAEDELRQSRMGQTAGQNRL